MDGIEWVPDSPHFDLGYYLVFARGISDSEFIKRIGEGGLSADAEMDIEETVLDEGGNIVRVGAASGWAYAVGPGYVALPPGMEEALSAGGVDVVVLSDNGNAVQLFIHLRDGTTLCGFEPGSAQTRSGTAPDLWVPALQRAGLLASKGRARLMDDDAAFHPGRAMLQMAQEELRLDLPVGEFTGRLAAVRVPAL